MIEIMDIDTAGRARIARLVTYEMARLGITRSRVVREWVGRIGPATVTRIRSGDPKVAVETLAAVGDLLGMPRGFLLYVGAGDVDRIAASGGDPDLIRWTLDMINETDNNGSEGSKSRPA